MRQDLFDLMTFAMVAEERSFTRAAARLGVTQSAVSHSLRALERRLDMQLLARTTRSVSSTAAGAALLKDLTSALELVERALADARRVRDRPAGRLRLLASRNAAAMVLLPKLGAFARTYPDVVVDVVTVSGPVDLVAGQYDAGIQIGESIPHGMVAVRVSQDLRLSIVGAPDYLRTHGVPGTPRDLAGHRCLVIRGPAGSHRWRFKKGSRSVTVSPDGPLVIDDTQLVIQAALDGVGLGIAFEGQVADYIAKHRLVRVLEDWCPEFPGYFLFYPGRRSRPATLTALINLLRIS